jgi:hypothetical protein
LVDLGVEPYPVRDVLLATLGQRLEVRPGKERRLVARLAGVGEG